MRYTNLQAIRTLAALAVVLSHLRYHAATKLGLESAALDWAFDYLCGPAVSVFFALSGYVLVLSLQRTAAREFFLGRLLRIFPAYWAAIGIAAAFTRLQGMPFPWDWRLATSMSLLPVGRERAFYPLTVEWTLVFEVFFYAALGLMLLIHRRHGPTIGAVCWLLAVAAAMIVRSPGPYEPLPDWSQIALSPFVTPFLLGVLAVRLQRLNRELRLAAPILVPSLFLLARLIPRWDVSILVMGAASALLVAWTAGIRQLASESIAVAFGDWSYGLYLLHVPIMTTIVGLAISKRLAQPSYDLIALAGLLAIGGGLLFGRCEAAVYRRLRESLVVRQSPTAEPRIIKFDDARTARAA